MSHPPFSSPPSPTPQVQPALLPFHDSTAHERPAAGSVRALRGAPTLSERWLPRKDLWAAAMLPGGGAEPPAIMTGPHQADLLRDSSEDADKPELTIKVRGGERGCQGRKMRDGGLG